MARRSTSGSRKADAGKSTTSRKKATTGSRGGTAAKKTTKSRTTTRATTGRKSTAKPRRSVRVTTREDIRQRAYDIYLSRNGGPGDALNDWLQAERELLA